MTAQIALMTDAMHARMSSMHGVTSHFSMALVAYYTIKKASNMHHVEIMRALNLNGHRFSGWTNANFGCKLSVLVAKLLNGHVVELLENHPDASAKRALDFINGK